MGSPKVVLIDCLRRHPLFRAPSWNPVYLPAIGAVLRRAGAAVHHVEAFELGDGKLPGTPTAWKTHVSDADIILIDAQIRLRNSLKRMLDSVSSESHEYRIMPVVRPHATNRTRSRVVPPRLTLTERRYSNLAD